MSILSSLFSKPAATITNLSTGLPALTSVKVVGARVTYRMKLHRHVLDDGTTVVDSKTMQPTEVSLNVICPDANSVSNVNTVLSDRSNLYTISVKGLTIPNITATTEQIKQSGEMLSASPVTLTFKTLMFDSALPVMPKAMGDLSLLDRGISALSSVTTSAATLASNVISKFGGLGG